MLVISRKSQEFVQIGSEIIVKVIKTSSGSVKIGIEAPGGLRVLRGELSEDLNLLPQPTKRSRRMEFRIPAESETMQPAEVL